MLVHRGIRSDTTDVVVPAAVVDDLARQPRRLELPAQREADRDPPLHRAQHGERGARFQQHCGVDRIDDQQVVTVDRAQVRDDRLDHRSGHRQGAVEELVHSQARLADVPPPDRADRSVHSDH
jgi:hypothetical protein